MNLRQCAVILVLAPVCQAAPGWVRLQSEHFELYSEGAEVTSRRLIQHLERARSFFQQAAGFHPAKSQRVRIVITSAAVFEEVTSNRFAAGLFVPGPERDLIVVNAASTDPMATATHEYYHLLELRSGVRFPPWLSEGLADLYSTVTLGRGYAVAGRLLSQRREMLLRSTWAPLEAVLGASRHSSYYLDGGMAAGYYNESYALTHMLALSDRYRNQFPSLVAALAAGQDSISALESTYKMPLGGIEADLRDYVSGQSFRIVRLPVQTGRLREPKRVQAASPFEVRLMLAEIAGRAGDRRMAREWLEALARKCPRRAEPHVAMAYLELQAKQVDAALAHFRKAFDLGATAAAPLWDMGCLLAKREPWQAARVFHRLVDRHPERADARIELAATYVNLMHPAAALETLKALKTAPPEHEARYFRVLTNAYLATGDRRAAGEAAFRWAAAAKTEAERSEAQRLLMFASGDN